MAPEEAIQVHSEDDELDSPTNKNNADVSDHQSLSISSQFSTISIADADSHKRTGYVDCLTGEQECRLMELWALVIELLSMDGRSSTITNKDKRKQKQQLADTLSKNASTHSLSSIKSTSSTRSAAIHDHPLSAEFWRQLSTDDPDVLLLRFLRARKWNVTDAFFMFFEALKWRRSFGVYELLRKGEYKAIKKSLLESGKGYFYGHDREGRLIVMLPAKAHDRYAQTLEENMAHTVLLMETGRRCMIAGQETVTLVFDLIDAPLSSFDPGSMQFMIECFQSYYPESLGRCYVVNAPWIFWGFWRMIKPWLDPVVASKIIFIDDLNELMKHIDPTMLMKEYGGLSDYKFKYHPPEEKDAPKGMSDAELQSINAEVEIEQTKLVDATLHLHTLLNNSMQLFDSAEPVLNARELAGKWRDERKVVISRLRTLLSIVDEAIIPPHMYKRLGVLRPDGTLDWSCLSK